MQFTQHSQSQLGRAYNFVPRVQIDSFFGVANLDDLDAVAVIVSELKQQYGDISMRGKWTYTLDRINPHSIDELRFNGITYDQVDRWEYDTTYSLEVVFSDPLDALQFKLAHC